MKNRAWQPSPERESLLSRGWLPHETLDGKSIVQGNRQGHSRSDSRSSAHFSDADCKPTAQRRRPRRHRQNNGHLNGSLNGSPVQEALKREVSRPGVWSVTKA